MRKKRFFFGLPYGGVRISEHQRRYRPIYQCSCGDAGNWQWASFRYFANAIKWGLKRATPEEALRLQAHLEEYKCRQKTKSR